VRPLTLSDSTLRDGNHAVAQKLDFSKVGRFIGLVDQARIGWIEVGHGNGLAASSLNFGKSPNTDEQILRIARDNVKDALLSVHVMPGIATFDRDVGPAIDLGVDIFRVASHCSEADTTLKMMSQIHEAGKTPVGVLMMAHRLQPSEFAKQAKVMYENGASAVFIMDSAGSLDRTQTMERVAALMELGMGEVGFHAHNNRGLAVSNSIAAIEAGASIIDGTAGGFGAGSGNAQMEAIIANTLDERFSSKAILQKYLEAVNVAEEDFELTRPEVSSLGILTGRLGIFSGFSRQIRDASNIYGVPVSEICEQLGKFETVAGQEDLVYEITHELASKMHPKNLS
jgi:4-hydroxy 2-oxovalerate aldolase